MFNIEQNNIPEYWKHKNIYHLNDGFMFKDDMLDDGKFGVYGDKLNADNKGCCKGKYKFL